MPKAVLMLAVLWVLTGASVLPSASGANGPNVPFVTMAAGRTSGIRQSLQAVIHDRDAWLALWRRHAGSAAVAPPVDFAREMVVAVFGGAGAGARTVTITRIARGPERLTVWYVTAERSPLPDEGGQTPAAPFHIVRLARSSLPVSFMQAKAFPVVPQP